jgi:hypothetical protein
VAFSVSVFVFVSVRQRSWVVVTNKILRLQSEKNKEATKWNIARASAQGWRSPLFLIRQRIRLPTTVTKDRDLSTEEEDLEGGGEMKAIA